MTVCLAALAADSKAIVCVSDKALTYGDIIQWDADSSKMLTVGDDCLAMFSGNEESTSRVLAALLCEPDIGKDVSATLRFCEKEYKDALDELIKSKFLTPRLLKKEEYIAAISGASMNEYVRGIAEEVKRFNMDCDLTLCGFDANGEAFILTIGHPGIATDMTNTGFSAIGAGWDKATARMLWSEHKRSHSIERSLYDAFDAKETSELTPGVGFEWESKVLVPNCPPIDVPKKIRDLVERAWDNLNISPFEKWTDTEYLDPPPNNWKSQLKKFAQEVITKGSNA